MPDIQYPNQNFKNFSKTITIIHAALTLGQVMFGVVAFLQIGKSGINMNTDDSFLFVAPLLAISCFIAGNLVFKQQLNNIAKKDTLKEKLMSYQAALITRYALLEGPSLFGIVCYMLTGNFLFLLISGLIVLYFITIRPTKTKIDNDLNLSYQDQIEFDRTDI